MASLKKKSTLFQVVKHKAKNLSLLSANRLSPLFLEKTFVLFTMCSISFWVSPSEIALLYFMWQDTALPSLSAPVVSCVFFSRQLSHLTNDIFPIYGTCPHLSLSFIKTKCLSGLIHSSSPVLRHCVAFTEQMNEFSSFHSTQMYYISVFCLYFTRVTT